MQKKEDFPMSDTDKIKYMEMENERLMEENRKLRNVITKLNQTLNRLIDNYIKSDKNQIA
jgi:predicted nuclease with TOPRIM domain